MGLVREGGGNGDKVITRKVSGSAKCEIIIITDLITSFSAFVKTGKSKDNVKEEFKIFQGHRVENENSGLFYRGLKF